jgi:hypothetical protein
MIGSAEEPPRIPERYQDVAARITAAALDQNDAYRKLERLCDDIGHRLSGSESLERGIAWALETLQRDGHENVRAEKVMVPRWVRGRESLELIAPRKASLSMLGLGGSVGTPPEGITAAVVSVKDEEGLKQLGEAGVGGKIVLFDVPMPPYDPERGTGYGTTVRYRSEGARLAAEYGAVACLVRSVTARSLRTPHTGAMRYGDAKTKIPAAAITIEDAAMITRLCARGVPVEVTLTMEARDEGQAPSANVIAELCGGEKPDEIVVISGHFDSWDVGQGAHDDGGGCVTAMEAINVLRKLGLRPRRTIRVVLWTNEENGLAGGRTYAKEHEAELPRHVAAIEMDSGVFAPSGYGVDHVDQTKRARAVEQMKEVARLLEPLGATKISAGGGGADISPMKSAGVPLLGHDVEMSTYFDYHHTPADTFDKIDPKLLSRNVAVMAVTAYVLADMPGRLGEEW